MMKCGGWLTRMNEWLNNESFLCGLQSSHERRVKKLPLNQEHRHHTS